MSFKLQNVLDHFGLQKRPFTSVPDPSFLFLSEQHSAAKSVLDYGVLSQAPITLITGEIGSGKTIVLREMLTRAHNDITVGLVANAAPADRVEMLRLILFALGETPADVDSYAGLYGQLEDFLVREYGEGRRVVLVFDEAQNLDRGSLEHLRLLTNINYAEHELLQLVLIGQPELQETVTRAELEQLAQRISAHYALTGLSAADVGPYIRHRLAVAGVEDELFEPETLRLIHDVSGGTPRIINQICDYCLLYAYGADAPTVTKSTLEEVLKDDFMMSASQGRALRVVASEPRDQVKTTNDTSV